MKRIIIMIAALVAAYDMYAAINAQYTFENGVPSFLTANGNATLSSSTEKFKDGTKSVKFSWSGPAELVFNNFSDIESSLKVNDTGIMMWVYNTSPMSDPITFTILDWNMNEICHFDFNADFCGWRAIWMKYIDMLTPTGHYGDKKLKERVTDAAGMIVKMPESAQSGTIYIDRVTFSKTKLHNQITPDKQIPENNYNLNRDMWQWCRLWEWEQYPMWEVRPVTASESEMLRKVEARIDEWARTGNPGKEYTAGTLLSRVNAHFEKYGIKRLPDGSVTGAPLMSDDEFNHSLGEMRIRFIQEIVYWCALDYLYTGNTSNVPRVIDAIDHALDQGFAYGSGWGTNHHYGYQVRDLYKGIWILRKEIAKTGKLDEYVKALSYWSGLQEARMPYEQTRDGILDAWHTLHNAKVISAMLQPNDEQKYAAMKALGKWTSGSLSYTDGTLGGIKIDGTSFHHGGHYPGYSVGAFAVLGDFCWFTKDTDFVIDEPARRVLKHTLLTLLDYCNLRDWGVGVCGRHPFNGAIPERDVEAFARLAMLGDLTGSGASIDPDLGGAYLTLGGKDKNLQAVMKQAGIKALPHEEGFRVYNYGGFGIHRRGDWMICLKGYNSDVWSTEIYAADNRFGRYISYGSAQIIGAEGAEASGYTQEGWDWNRYPGVTSIHLPFEKLDSPIKGTLMERNTSRFPGVSSLEGRNGCLAFTYVERDRVNFCAGATATKSVFCFDNRIVHIGTGITNNSTYPTETTIYQLKLNEKTEEVDINDVYAETFPFSYKHMQEDNVKLTDTKGNVYLIKNGYGLTVEKKAQTSPSDTKKKTGNGNFITAYIDHGSAPQNVSYEYLMLVKPSSKDEGKFSKKLPYQVIQADNSAHVVKDDITGITAYISYNGYSSDKTIVAQTASETIVMERTKEDGSVVMSICTPDLGITQKGYTTSQTSQILEKKVVLNGAWTLAQPNENVTVSSEGGNTVIVASCCHGQPVEFLLYKTK
jgi:chondroitin-sulfate-ABC endolyase/exolyase